MANANEASITLPADLVESVLALAKEQRCATSELVREALRRYEAFGRLTDAIAAGEDRSEALDDLLMDYSVRMVHETRAERRTDTRQKAAAGERKAS